MGWGESRLPPAQVSPAIVRLSCLNQHLVSLFSTYLSQFIKRFCDHDLKCGKFWESLRRVLVVWFLAFAFYFVPANVFHMYVLHCVFIQCSHDVKLLSILISLPSYLKYTMRWVKLKWHSQSTCCVLHMYAFHHVQRG